MIVDKKLVEKQGFQKAPNTYYECYQNRDKMHLFLIRVSGRDRTMIANRI